MRPSAARDLPIQTGSESNAFPARSRKLVAPALQLLARFNRDERRLCP